VIDTEEVLERAYGYTDEIASFLMDIVAIPSLSGQEKDVVDRIKAEMKQCGFDEVSVDAFGNVIGRIGNGKTVIAMDAHIDVVDVGERDLWDFEPFSPFIKDGKLYGRGASDQKGGMASMVYGMKILKELGLIDDFTVYITGTVQEEDCDGLCWQYILKEGIIKPEVVVLTEPTGLKVYRGQRGRMEIKVTTKGVSAHGSAPERGDNAIYKMAPILLELKELNERLKHDDFLGKGTLTVSQIFFKSPSACSVADECSITIDRRLTAGETKESAIREIMELKASKEVDARVELYRYDKPTYTGLRYPTDKYFPTWSTPEGHKAVKSAITVYENLFDKKPVVDKWTFSTNGVAISGMFGIPCVGFGPGYEEQAHAPNEYTPVEHLPKAAAFYALFPYIYTKGGI